MIPSLPSPVAAYMEASARLDADAILAPFADDAVVADERRTHRGRAEVRDWIQSATIGNQAVPTPRSYRPEGEHHLVVAEVTGPFPGSPVTLTFDFILTGDRIASLDIR